MQLIFMKSISRKIRGLLNKADLDAGVAGRLGDDQVGDGSKDSKVSRQD